MTPGDALKHTKTGRLYVYDTDLYGRILCQRLNGNKTIPAILNPDELEVVPTITPEPHEWTFMESVVDKPDRGRAQVFPSHMALGSAACLQYLAYDPLTGSLRYKCNVGRLNRVGLEAGSPAAHGLRVVTINGKRAYAHRIAWMMYTGDWPTGLLYHTNRDSSRGNLAIANWRMVS